MTYNQVIKTIKAILGSHAMIKSVKAATPREWLFEDSQPVFPVACFAMNSGSLNVGREQVYNLSLWFLDKAGMEREFESGILMERCSSSISNYLDGKGASFDFALAIAKSVAATLTIAHLAGIVHRDIKPENIFIASDYAIVLGDWGLAHLPSEERLTIEGSIFGTHGFIAPELLSGIDVTNVQSDIYSLGKTLEEIVHPDDRSRLDDLITWCTNTDPSLRPTAAILFQSCSIPANIGDARALVHQASTSELVCDEPSSYQWLAIPAVILIGGAIALYAIRSRKRERE
jgi:serine/threonine protein kinase